MSANWYNVSDSDALAATAHMLEPNGWRGQEFYAPTEAGMPVGADLYHAANLGRLLAPVERVVALNDAYGILTGLFAAGQRLSIREVVFIFDSSRVSKFLLDAFAQPELVTRARDNLLVAGCAAATIRVYDGPIEEFTADYEGSTEFDMSIEVVDGYDYPSLMRPYSAGMTLACAPLGWDGSSRVNADGSPADISERCCFFYDERPVSYSCWARSLRALVRANLLCNELSPTSGEATPTS